MPFRNMLNFQDFQTKIKEMEKTGQKGNLIPVIISDNNSGSCKLNNNIKVTA